ncbi:MAG: serine hydrolase domain-containing protein [Candidatus Zhuqueibacterota bacterium]
MSKYKKLKLTTFLTGSLLFLILSIGCSGSIRDYSPVIRNQHEYTSQKNQEIIIGIQKILDQSVNDQKIPGLQLAIKFPDQSHWIGTSGTLTPKREIQLTNDSMLRIGSVTKLYTAVLTLKAVEQGKISLPDTLAKWFPGIPNSEKITLIELLNHTSGLREILESFSVKMKSIFPHKNWKPSELLKIISKQKPYFKPGTDFHYSNSNYIILGFILEHVYKKSIGSLLEDEIITPLELKSTYLLPQAKIPQNLIPGFDSDLLPWPGLYQHKPDNTAWASLAFTSGAMATTANEQLTFINALFDGGLVSDTLLKSMVNFVNVDNKDHPYWTGYGLAVTRFNINNYEYWGHEGLFIGFEAIALYSPSKNYSIALIGNVSSFDKFEIIRQIQEILSQIK